MRTYLHVFLCLSILVVSCLACNKSNNNSTPTKTVTERLATATWKYQSAGLDFDNNGTVDQQDPYLQNCKKDNLVTFNTNGTGTNDEGATVCNAGDPQTMPFTWTLTEADKKITSNGTTVNIFELTDSNLKVYIDTLVGNTSYRYLTISTH